MATKGAYLMVDVQESERLLQLDTGKICLKYWRPETTQDEKRPPILLLHDSIGCIPLWRDFPKKLTAATQRTVIAYDRLGYGRSDKRTDFIGFDFVADEAKRVVPQIYDLLGIEDFVVCGHSVGGGMGIEIAAHFQGRCKGLITIAAQAFVEDRTLEGIRKAQTTFQTPEQFARLKKYHGDKSRWVLDAWIDTWLAAEFKNWNLDEALSGVRCPVLAIHGEKDEYGSLEHPKRIAQGHGKLCVVPGAGHSPHLEQENFVLEAIKSLLSPLENDPCFFPKPPR